MMNLGDIVQSIVTVGAVTIAATYLIGGLIVNLNLTRRGVVEYQILKVKYLAVGVIFLFQFLGVVVFTFIPVVLLVTVSTDPIFIQAISIPSILASLTLLYVWSRYPPNTTSFMGRWSFWFTLSVIGTLFPLFTIFHFFFVPSESFQWVFNYVLGALASLLAVMAQIYHYSSFYYGRSSNLGALDPIGMGIPTRVNLVCDKEIASSLRTLNLPVQKNIIRDVYLIDETDNQYIISQEQVPSGSGDDKTYKINKDLIKVVMHTPDHMRKLTKKSKINKTSKAK